MTDPTVLRQPGHQRPPWRHPLDRQRGVSGGYHQGRRPAGPVAINTRVNNFVGGAMDVMAQTTIDPNQREMRVRMNPVFLNRNAARPTVANSMVPGGF